MDSQKLEVYLGDRTFLSILVVGVLISLFISVNNRSFNSFILVFLSGSVVSLLVAVSWSFIENRYISSVIVIAIFLTAGFTALGALHNQSRCLAWSAHSAENLVTGECKAFVYGGCGPTPEPWYYTTCSEQSQEELCNQLQNSSREDSDKLYDRLCIEYPDLNLSILNYDEVNETLKLQVTESEFNLSNTDKLRIEPWENRSFRIRKDGKTYDTSVLIAEAEPSIFNGSLDSGDEFTIVYDGTDFDNDNRSGADFRDGDWITYVLEWWNNKYNGTDVAVAQINSNRSISVEQLY